MSRSVSPILLTAFMFGFVHHAMAQRPDPIRELERRAREIYFERQVDSFIENVYEFYEIGGELISFRVHPNMTSEEFNLINRKSRELDDKAEDLISFIHYAVPGVRGKTEDLWVILEPLDESADLERRLTLLLSLINGLEPKIQHLLDVLTEEQETAVDIEELTVEVALPYLIAGGLEELRTIIRDLRQAL